MFKVNIIIAYHFASNRSSNWKLYFQLLNVFFYDPVCISFPPTDFFVTPKPYIDAEWNLPISYAHSSIHSTTWTWMLVYIHMRLPWWLSDKEFTCNEGDAGSIPGSGISLGEGNDHPLQYSCLETLMDRGAWWATVHGVAKSQTWLSNWAYTYMIDRYIHTQIHIYGLKRITSIELIL